jgi:hypothetical protein
MTTSREPAHLPPVDPRLTARSYHQNSLADATPVATRRRRSIVHETSSYPPLPTYLCRCRTLLVAVALLAFATLVFFVIVSQVFADVPSPSATVLVDSFPSAQYFTTTSSFVDVISSGTLINIFCDQRSLGEPLLGDTSRDNIDLEALGPQFQTHLVQIDLEDWRMIGLRKSRPSDIGKAIQRMFVGNASKVPRSSSAAFSDCASHQWRLYQQLNCLFTSSHGFWSLSANFPSFESSAFNQGWLISQVPRRASRWKWLLLAHPLSLRTCPCVFTCVCPLLQTVNQ